MTTTPAPLAVPSRRRVIVHVALAAVALIALFRVTVESSSRPSSTIVREALTAGADRLLELQRPDGLWPAELHGPGDLASSGRSARALLTAWKATRDSRYLSAASRAADSIIPRLAVAERTHSLGNLMFLAELGEVTGDTKLGEMAHQAWERRLTVAERVDGALAARTLFARKNPTAWLEGSWRNYVLGRAGDEVELARVVGEDSWADAYAVTAAQSWAPKRDYDFWGSATSGMVLALAGSESAEARRLLDVELSILRQDELAPGLIWSDSPYDSYVYASETAAVLRGLIASGSPEARRAAADAALLVAARQAEHGGWGEMLSLFDQVAEEGSAEVPAAALASDETPELDSQIVQALAELLRAPITLTPAS